MKLIATIVLVASALHVAQAAEVCAKDSEGNWKTPKGANCYMGAQPVPVQTSASGAATGATAGAATSANTPANTSASTGASVTPASMPKAQWKVQLSDVYIANTLHRWAAAGGYRVKWDAAKNFMIEAPDTYQGTFEEVVAQLLSAPGIQTSKYPLDVCFYPNTPPLARVTLRGEQDKECK